MKMTKGELNSFLNAALKDSIHEDSTFIARQAENFDYYLGEPLGDEEEGRSQVVSMDCQDLVEADLPSLARIFLSSNDIMEFAPLGHGEDEIKEAEEKTKYINYLVRGQRNSYKTLIDWIKESEIQTSAVVKFYVEEKKTTDVREYEGLSEDELVVLMQDLQGMKGVELVDPIEQEEEDGKYHVTFRVTKKTKKFTIATVPIENFHMTKSASSKDDAMIVGDIQYKTKGQLVSEGWEKEKVKDLPSMVRDTNGKWIHDKRLPGERSDNKSDGGQWTADMVMIEYLYPLVDADGDGIPERRHVVRAGGSKILEDKPFGIVPYAILSGITMPHMAIGRSRTEIAKPTQKFKTHLVRGMADNIYSVSRPSFVINDMDGKGAGSVEMDDLLTERLGRIIRVDGPVAGNIMPVETPFVGDKILMTVQYVDAARAQTTGSLMAQQGLNKDALYRETATRFDGVSDQSEAKIELVARNLAETGFRELYEGMAWLVAHYQDDVAEMAVLGKTITIDPRKWKYEHYCTSSVGLGAGDTQEMIANMSGLFTTLKGLQAEGSLLVDSKKVFNAGAKLIKLMGIHNVPDYLNDPESEPEQLMALLEQSMKQNQQLRQAIDQMQPEMIRAKAQMEIENNRANIQREKDAAEYDADLRKYMLSLAQSQEKWQAEMKAEMLRFMQDQLTKRTELDLKYNPAQNDIPETLEDGAVVSGDPVFGDITEADIQETMRANNMTREEVMRSIE